MCFNSGLLPGVRVRVKVKVKVRVGFKVRVKVTVRAHLRVLQQWTTPWLGLGLVCGFLHIYFCPCPHVRDPGATEYFPK